MAVAVAVAIFAVGLSAAPAAADPGDLLTGFGTDGLLFEDAALGEVVERTILHPDHDLLIATRRRTDDGDQRIGLIQVDSAAGVVLSNRTLAPDFDGGSPIHLRPDGLGGVIVGTTVSGDPNQGGKDLLIFRLGGGLELDSGFGLRQLGFDLSPNPNERMEDLEVLSDGRIVALTSVATDEGTRIGLVFLKPDGSPDTSLPNGGLELIPNPVDEGLIPEMMAVDSRDRLWIGAFPLGPSPQRMAVTRVLPDASLDSSFGTSGIGLFDFRPCASCPADSTASLADIETLGEVAYVLASVEIGLDQRNAAATALGEAGGPDPALGGWTRIPFLSPPGGPSPGRTLPISRLDLEVDPERRGLVVATTGEDQEANPSRDYVGLTRVRPGGGLDTAFGNGGTVTHSFGEDASFTQPYLTVKGRDDLTDMTSSARITVLADDIAVMAVEGFFNEIFADGFESGDTSAWSDIVP
ncbi:MAG: hypothetical protein AAGF23_18590 [Acidobacteriota bacterium]